MSSADVETVRQGIAAYNKGDPEGLIEISDPEVTLIPLRSLLEGGGYDGHDGVRRFLSDMDEDWEAREIELDEIRDLDDRVLVLGNFHAVGRASGSDFRQPVAWLCEMRDGKLLRMQAYSDREAALAEAG